VAQLQAFGDFFSGFVLAFTQLRVLLQSFFLLDFAFSYVKGVTSEQSINFFFQFH